MLCRHPSPAASSEHPSPGQERTGRAQRSLPRPRQTCQTALAAPHTPKCHPIRARKTKRKSEPTVSARPHEMRSPALPQPGPGDLSPRVSRSQRSPAEGTDTQDSLELQTRLVKWYPTPPSHSSRIYWPEHHGVMFLCPFSP